MTRTRGRRLSTCHHEAGHAVARWWMGFDTHSAAVLSVEEVRAGHGLVDRRGTMRHGVEGMVCGYEIEVPLARQVLERSSGDARDALVRHAAVRVEMALVEAYAGALAQAVFAKRSGVDCFLHGGMADLNEARRMAADWFVDKADQDRVHGRSERIARALVRSPKAWAAIQAMAAALLDRGRIDGDEVDALCATAYGAPFTYDRWAEAWPPTPDQIRSGFLPAEQQRAA